ncbi:MAG: three-Cys-motif partner protein TcmP [Nitrosotalea sp.]
MDIPSHTAIKHHILAYYFKCCKDTLRYRMKKYSAPLYYIDLYCRDGETLDKTTRKTFLSPFVKSFMQEGVVDEKLDIKFVLNDFDDNKIKILQDRIDKLKISSNVIDIQHKDANSYIDDVLTKVPNYVWSIFFLDPFKHKQLKWSTIEKIANHSYTGKKNVRRPEMIIHLPTYTLSNGLKSNSYKDIDEFFGTDSWLEKINKYRIEKRKQPVISGFRDTFVERIEALGYKVASIPIESIEHNVPIYYLIFAVANDNAYKIVKSAIDYSKALKPGWIDEKQMEIDKVKAVGTKGKSLLDYTN